MYDVEPRPAATVAPAVAVADAPEPMRKRTAGTGRGEGSQGTPTDQTQKPAPDGPQKAAALDGKPKPVTVTSQAQQVIDGGTESRTSVGIGELVWFYAETAKDEGAEGTWSATAGTVTPEDGRMTWAAPDTAGDATVTFTPTTGTAKSVKMKVVAPTGLVFKKTGEFPITKGQGSGMLLSVRLAPFDVSFNGIQWKESDVPASNAKGFFAGIPLPPHKAAAAAKFGANNDGPNDQAEFHGATGKLTEGSFDWVIPQAYIYKGKAVPLDAVTQTCKMENGGSTVCTKATEASNPRSPS